MTLNSAKPQPPAREVTSLAHLASGGSGEVVEIVGPPEDRLRLFELGLLPGVRVRMIRKSPFGCPVEVEFAGGRYTLRRETAAFVVLRAGGNR